jgi:dTDP-4-dehydrorhamnose reductase
VGTAEVPQCLERHLGVSRWLVTGAGGMLGRDVLAALHDAEMTGAEVTAPQRNALDVTDADALTSAVRGHDIVVNCAAWTAVDDAESHEPQAFSVNAVGAANLARACARHGARLVQVSTDYVFEGSATSPYPEDAPLAPRSAYGRTKAAGEWAVRAELPDRHWIVRTAWLYGEHGPNFVRTMAQLERSRPTVDVVDDQHGQPTWSADVARRIVEMAAAGAPSGTYHATSSGTTTWYHLARAVFTHLGADPDRVRPTTSDAFVRPAPRPAWSVLSHEGWRRAGLAPLRSWDEALTHFMATSFMATR